MKTNLAVKINRYFLIVLLSLPFWIVAQTLEERLTILTETNSFEFEKIETGDFFSEKYLLRIEQPVDQLDTNSKHFTQRVFLSHNGFSDPVVFVTEGYAATYAENPAYVNELCPILNANLIVVEHRYFGESVPDSIDWRQLTVFNAASDHHRIVALLKQIYSGKWVNTGISKGGQTTMYHRYFFPDDVEASVAYVAPLNFSIEDKRVYYFLDTVGSELCREKILEFQTNLLKNKSRYLPEFEKLAEEKKLTYKMGYEKAFELLVFEYSFAFWQWGRFSCEEIPPDTATPTVLIAHLDKVAGIDWISNEGLQKMIPFFYQAMFQIGFYGYDIAPFKEWVSYTENPTFEFTLPEGVKVNYEQETMEQIDCFIRHKAENMLFIYGGADAWSATAVDLTLSTNSVKIVKPGGSHRTRIHNLPANQKELAIGLLKEWLKIKN